MIYQFKKEIKIKILKEKSTDSKFWPLSDNRKKLTDKEIELTFEKTSGNGKIVDSFAYVEAIFINEEKIEVFFRVELENGEAEPDFAGFEYVLTAKILKLDFEWTWGGKKNPFYDNPTVIVEPQPITYKTYIDMSY